MKELSAGSRISSDQHLDKGKCPDDQIEATHLRKVLEVLGHSCNLKEAETILESFAQDYTSRVLIADFEKLYLSGFPPIKDHTKTLNFLKKRIDGFI